MKKSWILLLFPILTHASYPIYEDDFVSSEKPETKAHPVVKEHEKGDQKVAEEHIRPESFEDKGYLNPLHERSQNRFSQKNSNTTEIQIMPAPTPSSIEKKKQSAISKHESRKKGAGKQTGSSRSKLHEMRRQNPNRPRVIQRDQQNSQILPKIEADAEDIEEGLSMYQDEELTNRVALEKEGSAFQKKRDSSKEDRKGIKPSDSSSKAKKNLGSHPGKRPRGE